MVEIRCQQCGKPYPETGLPFRCDACGGVYDYDGPPQIATDQIEQDLPGLWKYRHAFGLFPDAPVVTLGEGNTPLIWQEYQGHQIGLKMESLNPTGSYKDRGTAVLISQLLARGASRAVEDSSGNAGSSFAAYAARSKMDAKVFVPDYASGPKRNQIESYGAELVAVPGPRSAAADAVLQEAESGAVYASHAYLPFGVMGIATISYEIWQDLGRSAGTIIAPAGHGSLLLGIVRGFQALKNAGAIDQVPYFVGVQAAACAPIYAEFAAADGHPQEVKEGETLAEGVRVRKPIRKDALLKEIPSSLGRFMAIEEQEIEASWKELGKNGVYVEPTSALVWSAMKNLFGKVPEPIILVMTGLGLKHYE